MRIALFGASGLTGSGLIAEARRRGCLVRAHVRSNGALLPGPLVEAVSGPLTDPGLVDRVVGGVAAVIVAFGPRPPYRDPFCAAATAAVISAMGRAGVRRLLCQTGAMIGELPGQLSGGMRFMAQWFRRRRPEVAADRAEQERLVRESGLDWTLVKPPRLTNASPAAGYRADPELPLTLFDSIRRTDLARFCFDEIQEPKFIHRRVYLAV